MKLSKVYNCRLRLCEKKDIHLLFKWANEKAVRQNALNENKIELELHEKWFESKMNSKSSYLYILELENEPLGQIRLDKIDNSTFWLIDYSIDVIYRSKGFGSKIVAELIRVKSTFNLKAIVKKENIPSQKVFEKLKFESNISSDKKYFEYMRVSAI